MGTHPNGPALLYHNPNTSLKALLATDPSYFLGSHTASKFSITSQNEQASQSPEIPFLFKVLSIGKVLPLQAHPDKALAEKLNRKDGKNFVDANHKPEIALALGDFKGFVGFKPLEEIRTAANGTPELSEAIGRDITLTDDHCLKDIMSALLLQPQIRIKRLVQRLVERLKTESINDPISRLVLDVNAQYPGDVGVLITPYLMNLVTLAQGDAIYIGVDEAHAYLDGDIIECMAISDNVVDAAFAPPVKRDTSTFIDMLKYSSRPAFAFRLYPQRYTGGMLGHTTAYDPPLAEFTALRTKLDPLSDKEELLSPAKGPTIGIVVNGDVEIKVDEETETLQTGAVIFVVAEKAIWLRTTRFVEVFWATLIT